MESSNKKITLSAIVAALPHFSGDIGGRFKLFNAKKDERGIAGLALIAEAIIRYECFGAQPSEFMTKPQFARFVKHAGKIGGMGAATVEDVVSRYNDVLARLTVDMQDANALREASAKMRAKSKIVTAVSALAKALSESVELSIADHAALAALIEQYQLRVDDQSMPVEQGSAMDGGNPAVTIGTFNTAPTTRASDPARTQAQDAIDA